MCVVCVCTSALAHTVTCITVQLYHTKVGQVMHGGVCVLIKFVLQVGPETELRDIAIFGVHLWLGSLATAVNDLLKYKNFGRRVAQERAKAVSISGVSYVCMRIGGCVRVWGSVLPTIDTHNDESTKCASIYAHANVHMLCCVNAHAGHPKVV